jgi:hypothetical protein
MPFFRKPADLVHHIAGGKRDPSLAADPFDKWHVKIYRPSSAVADIAQTTLPTWRTLRAYIETARRFWPDSSIEVVVPEAAPETVLTELRAMGVETSAAKPDHARR